MTTSVQPSVVLGAHGDPRIVALFLRRVIVSESGCWMWGAAKGRGGYGVFSFYDKGTTGFHTVIAHRFSYRAAHGNLPRQLDHLFCDTPACVNPFHVVPTTPRENTLRSSNPAAINARKTHCKNGHEFTDANTLRINSGRRCRICKRLRERGRVRVRRKAVVTF